MNTPTLPGPLGEPNVRFVKVRDHNMAPTLHLGDWVAVAPVTRFHRDALYLIAVGNGETSVTRCAWRPDGILIKQDGPEYADSPSLVSQARFEAIVLGIVVFTINVHAADFLATDRGQP